MKDVAKLAAVSASTVSRVLSNDLAVTGVPISPETVSRVQAAVKKLGYHPNLHARSLRNSKTGMIAMMIADISNPYYHHMVRKVQDVARQNGYDVMIANTDHDIDEERYFLRSLIRRPVDGVILTPYHLSSADINEMADRTGTHVALLGQNTKAVHADMVYANDGGAVYDATQWLITQRHHKRIAHIAVPHTKPGERRLAGFNRAMAEAKLRVWPGYVPSADFTVESGDRAMRALLKLPVPPSAVIACNDLIALGCISAAQALGARIPEDIAIVGFDNIPDAARQRPALTTIAQYPTRMGELLANCLFDRIQGAASGPSKRHEVPCDLIVRESA